MSACQSFFGVVRIYVTYTKRESAISFSFELSLEFGQDPQSSPLELADPAFDNLVDRHRVEVMQLLAAAPNGDHQVGLFQKGEVLGHCLPGHVQMGAEFSEGLTIVCMEPVEELPAAWVG